MGVIAYRQLVGFGLGGDAIQHRLMAGKLHRLLERAAAELVHELRGLLGLDNGR